jgi:hypothetical protein
MVPDRMTVLLPITPTVKTACDGLEVFISDFIAAWGTLPPLGKYESEVEAHNLFKLVIRDAEGILELARRDLILLPPALAAARACFETAVKASWLVYPENPFDREARYLVHLKGEERSIRRIAERISDKEFQKQLFERERSIREFRVGVEDLMPKEVKLLPGIPSFEEMLADLGSEDGYRAYIMLSQYVHGEHAATWLYRRKGLGTENQRGEFIELELWWLPLYIAYISLSLLGFIFVDGLAGDPDRFSLTDTGREIQAKIDAVKIAPKRH